MKKHPLISVAIATYNESENIKRCLDSVLWADEIIVVDGGSTDKTQDFVKSYPKTTLIITDNPPMFHLNKQKAIDACRCRWILQLDADEQVTPGLKQEILDTIVNTTHQGYWINRRNYFLGHFLSKGGIYPDPTIRLYQRGSAHLPCLDVHEQAVVTGSIGHLKNDLLHFADPTFSRYLNRNDRYTSLLAHQLLDKKVSLSVINFINYFLIKPAHWFFLSYFLHRGYVDGFPGFVFAFYSSLRFPIAYIKLYELKHNNK